MNNLNPAPQKPRSLGLSIRRGLAGYCPNCGKGKMFGAYLKVLPACFVCHEDLSPQRADDLPAYIVLFIVGHIVIGGMMTVETYWEWPVMWHIILWPILTLILSLILLPRIKGAVIGLQWALRMHEFSRILDGDEVLLFKSSESP